MQRDDLMKRLEQRAFERRIGFSSVFRKAGVSYTVLYRWQRGECVPTLPTIGKLERQLEAMEAAS